MLMPWPKTIWSLAAIALAACLSRPAIAGPLNVFACEPEWGALATELGGDRVNVFTATTARQDPHQIQARPALIARLRQADLVVCTGAELEIGWMPILMRQSANGRIQPGSPGYFAAAEQVPLLDIPARLDRADGDIHAAGNPHVQGDPRRMATIAAALAKRLAALDSANATFYRERGHEFAQRLDRAIRAWDAQTAPLRNVAVVVHHKGWVYLLDWLGMREVAAIEPKPGVPAGPAHLAQLLADLPRQRARMILVAAYQDPRPAQFVAEKSGLPAVVLPFTVGGNEAAGDLIAFYADTVDRLIRALGVGRDGS
jgi:zinc/manganese transport system substrate-binding protein